MADIPINEVTRRVQFTGNTTTGPFAFTFNILSDDDIIVYKNFVLQTITTHYTVSTNANGTGSITLTSALVASDVLTIIGGRALERTTDFVTAGDLLASSLNEQLDSQVIMTQQLDEKLDRSLKVDIGDQFTDLSLPSKANRLGTVLAFNATSGDPEAGPQIADVSTLAAITADIATLADIEDGTDATDAIQTVANISSAISNVSSISTAVSTVSSDSADVQTLAGISTDIQTLADIEDGTTATDAISDVAAIATSVSGVAGISTEVTNVAGKLTEIGRLGTADAVADLAILGTTDAVSDMNTLAAISTDIASVAAKASFITADFVSDLNTLAVTDVVNDLNTLATSDIVADINLLATTDIVNDLNTLATTDVVADLNQLATSDIVADIALLADTDVIADLNTLATTDIVSDLNTLATTDIVADLNQLATSDFVADLNTMATTTNVNNLATVAGGLTNINTVAGSISNVNDVASNITGVNSFAERYRVGSADPTTSLDAGDLAFNTTDNGFKFYDGSSWQTVNVSGIGNIVEDTTPQLGGNLDVNGNEITSASSGNVVLNPNGSGQIQLNSTVVVQDGTHDFDVASHDGTNGLKLGGTLVTSTAAELNILDGVTSTATELNILDGVTATTSELNILDGVTATTAELNILDGVTATATELNLLDGVTATTTELNYVDVTTLGTSQASKAVTADANGDVNLAEELKAKSYNETYAAVTSSSNATTVNCENGNAFSHTLTENTTFTFSGEPASGTAFSFSIEIIQDASASGYTVTWPTSVDWPSATAPTLTATASAKDVFVFYTRDGGTNWYGFTAGQALG